jgi:dipeptidyl aminopeptidase/acylaminoacyl peptidase
MSPSFQYVSKSGAIVPSTQSALLNQALEAAGNNVTLIELPEAGHNFGADEASWEEAQHFVLAFFKQHL